jgi:hypothetical protein
MAADTHNNNNNRRSPIITPATTVTESTYTLHGPRPRHFAHSYTHTHTHTHTQHTHQIKPILHIHHILLAIIQPIFPIIRLVFRPSSTTHPLITFYPQSSNPSFLLSGWFSGLHPPPIRSSTTTAIPPTTCKSWVAS